MLPDGLAQALIEKAGFDRLSALYASFESVRRGGTVSISGVYGGAIDPMPMMQLFDKGIQIRMGQAHVKRWIDDILPLVSDDGDPLGTEDFASHRLPLTRRRRPTRSSKEAGRDVQGRLRAVSSPATAEELIPPGRGLRTLREAARSCRACPLWRDATQVVFGAGPANAEVMLIGEVPGDQEDRAGEPFVGPAGRLLDKAVDEAGLDRDRVYVTNAVKHFKYRLRGKRRIHQTPSKLEVEACRPWLEAELARVGPHAVGLLGATAAKALLGPGFKVSERRGDVLEVDFAKVAVATFHPSSVLRGPPEQREEAYGALVDDLRILSIHTRDRG